ncbi:hypothetical protein CUB96_05275 [Akkermansia muciniphila]|nr:hypothetical protein CUB96_05275 [Akkermansia muciniphila]
MFLRRPLRPQQHAERDALPSFENWKETGGWRSFSGKGLLFLPHEKAGSRGREPAWKRELINIEKIRLPG